MIPEEEVLIAFKIVKNTYTLDPYDFVSKGLKGGGGTSVYNEVEINYCRLAKLRDSPCGPLYQW